MSDVDTVSVSPAPAQGPPTTLAKTRSEVIALLKAYMSEHGGAAGGTKAVEALAHEFDKIEPVLAFQFFCDLVLKVNKAVIGTEDDPTGPILRAAVEHAQSPKFWVGATDDASKDHLENLLKRFKTLLSVLCRQQSFSETVSVLQLLERLPLSGDLLKQVEIPTVIERLAQAGDETVRENVRMLSKKYPAAFKAESGALDSKVTSLKLFGDQGALKMNTHKRAREPSPPPQEDKDSTLPEQTEVVQPAAKKQRKHAKRVSWKPESELVQVRFYEIEGTVRFRSAKNAKQQELEEGTDLHIDKEWTVPVVINFNEVFGGVPGAYESMASRRGGLKEPDSEEARAQEQRESRVPGGMFMTGSANDSSPAEPPESERGPDPNSTPAVGGRFIAAEPFKEWLEENMKEASPTMMPGALPPQLGMPGMMPGMPGIPGMPGMPGMGMPGAPPMMPMGMPFPWAMNFPMNMGGPPNQQK